MNISYKTILPWSYSKWKSLNNCSLQFYLKYILKIKGVYVEAPETTIGKAAHSVLENIIMGLDFLKALEKVKPEYEKQLNWKVDVEEGLGSQLLNFQSRFSAFKRNHEVVKIFQERKVGLRDDFTQTTFFAGDCFYRGVIDLCMYLKNGDAVILDHKTGAPAAMGLTNFQGQLDVYKILSHYGIEQVKGVATGIHFIRDGQIKIGQRSGVEEVEGTIKNNLLFLLSNTIDNLNEAGKIEKKKGSYCKYCDYAQDCKDKKLDKYVGEPIHVYRTEIET